MFYLPYVTSLFLWLSFIRIGFVFMYNLCSNELNSCIHQVAAVLTLPFDVVKTRRQIQLGEMETLGGP